VSGPPTSAYRRARRDALRRWLDAHTADELEAMVDHGDWRAMCNRDRRLCVELMGAAAAADPALDAQLVAANDDGDGRAFAQVLADGMRRRLRAESN
jgi:hypothetical protein